jgi:hypothetical protein
MLVVDVLVMHGLVMFPTPKGLPKWVINPAVSSDGAHCHHFATLAGVRQRKVGH